MLVRTHRFNRNTKRILLYISIQALIAMLWIFLASDPITQHDSVEQSQSQPQSQFTSPSPSPSPPPSPPTSTSTKVEEPIVLFDETKPWIYDFSKLPDGPLDANYWNFETGTTVADYNNEAQAYTNRQSNVRVENGQLIIEARPEVLHGRTYTSARINTKDKFAFTNGTIEVDMMLPQGKGTWPAAWLLPQNEKYDPSALGIEESDDNACLVNGEIDFAETIGSLPGENIPDVHSYNSIREEKIYTPGYITKPYTSFNKFGIIKTPNKLTFTLNGIPYAYREKTSDDPKDWPYDQSYYLILNLALGGEWAGYEGIDDSFAPWQLKIRSIEFTPLPG